MEYFLLLSEPHDRPRSASSDLTVSTNTASSTNTSTDSTISSINSNSHHQFGPGNEENIFPPPPSPPSPPSSHRRSGDVKHSNFLAGFPWNIPTWTPLRPPPDVLHSFGPLPRSPPSGEEEGEKEDGTIYIYTDPSSRGTAGVGWGAAASLLLQPSSTIEERKMRAHWRRSRQGMRELTEGDKRVLAWAEGSNECFSASSEKVVYASSSSSLLLSGSAEAFGSAVNESAEAESEDSWLDEEPWQLCHDDDDDDDDDDDSREEGCLDDFLWDPGYCEDDDLGLGVSTNSDVENLLHLNAEPWPGNCRFCRRSN